MQLPQKTPRVSVIMPVFNGEKYIAEAVGSVLASEFRDFELLVLDDGSTDRSIAEATRAAAGDERVHLISLQHDGIAATRNAGLTEAVGEFIANLDADDAMFPDRLALQVAYLDRHPECVAVGSRALVVDAAGKPVRIGVRYFSHEEIDRAHIEGRGGAIWNPTATLRREAVESVGGYEPGLHSTGEDHDLWLRMAEMGELANLPEVLIRYRVHEGNASVGPGKKELRLAVTLATLDRAFQRRRITDRKPAKLKAPPPAAWERRCDAALLRYYSGNHVGAIVPALIAWLASPTVPATRSALRTILNPRRSRWRWGALALVVFVGACSHRDAVPGPGDAARRVEWPSVGGDATGLRYSSLADVDRVNVNRLRPIWEWKTGEKERTMVEVGQPAMPGPFEATPVMLGDTLYFSTPYSRAIALDANTGRELWSFDPDAPRWGQIMGNHSGFVHRGVAVWTGPAGRRVFLTSRWRLYALDAATGRPVPSFGDGGEVDLTHDLRWPVDRYEFATTSPPLIVGNLVVVGSAIADEIVHDRDPPGDVQAFDVETGRRAWRWSPLPAPGEPGSESWEEGAAERTGHANVWPPFTADTARGLIYLPVSTPSNDYYGGRRKGNNLYAESIVCLDAHTGKRVWYYQLVHHGLWDYDPATPPALVSLVVDGKAVDAVVIAGKTGFVYLFDRVTGIPVWPIEERPVPASDVPGERAAVTQPVPSRPAPFVRQRFTMADVADFTPAIHARALAVIGKYRIGSIFTPPSLQGTVVLPGWIGGAGWGSMSFDPESGTLYVKGNNWPTLARLVPVDPTGPHAGARYTLDLSRSPDSPLSFNLPTHTGVLRWFSKDVRISVIRPPYGNLTAFDLNRGELLWQVVLGDTPDVRNHPQLRARHLPPLGVAGAVGGIVTRGGLIFITGGGNTLYALDKTDGRVLWQWDLKRIGQADPMTYRTALGRQFVVIASGTLDDARLRAFALPAQ